MSTGRKLLSECLYGGVLGLSYALHNNSSRLFPENPYLQLGLSLTALVGLIVGLRGMFFGKKSRPAEGPALEEYYKSQMRIALTVVILLATVMGASLIFAGEFSEQKK